MLWHDCNQPKELIRYLKSTCCLCLIYLFPKNITVMVLDKNVTVLTFKEYNASVILLFKIWCRALLTRLFNTLDTCAQKECWNIWYIASFSKYSYEFDKTVIVLINLA